jgi:hypothetical protein
MGSLHRSHMKTFRFSMTARFRTIAASRACARTRLYI